MSEISPILQQYPDYEVNIGIEVHVQLATNSKIFCLCPNEINKEPNKNICNICTGQPGVLPVLNEQVIEFAILTGLATNCTIAPISCMARKHYFYPDLPKGYQTTQSNEPICEDGHVAIRLEDGSLKQIRLIRIHMEEDAGKNIHAAASNESFVDLNRAGTPLLEVVTHPDISSAYEAKAYLKTLRAIVQYLDVCSGNMEDGAFRADTNISVRKKGAPLGTRTELKNINSFKFIGDAIEYEVERQITALEEGKAIRQETRLWDTKDKKTVMMRSKEEAADYRYFPCPDLPLIKISEEWIESKRKLMPELPHQKFERFVANQGLTNYEADMLVDDRQLATYFESAIAHHNSKSVINWVLRDVLGYLKDAQQTFAEFKVTPEKLAQIIKLLDAGTINNNAAKQVFELIAKSGGNPADIVKEQGLEQIGSIEELESIVKELIAANPENVALYRSGKDKIFGFFVGQAMQKTKGKGDPKVIQDLLKKHLA